MKFAQADSGDGHLINGYESGRILVDGHSYHDGIIVSPERIVQGWGPESAADLNGEHLAEIVALGPEIIIVGTGERQVFPNPHIYFGVVEQGMGFEVMDTGAACRTYNILMSEGRKVAAGLMRL